MCGIIGGLTKYSFDHTKLLESIDHRGPNNQGFFKKGDLFFGHTRLSIQDLSARGNQPMFSNDGKYVIIFNGEIYNHLEIRKTQLRNCKFKSSCDTETVLQAYIHLGESCLEIFNGIFAFAIFNIVSNEIIIARDHFGVKPLYFYKDDEKFFFGSEIKSFLNFNIDLSISYESIINYLTFLWSPGETTPFRKVTKLLPGHYMKFNVKHFKNAAVKRFFQDAPNGNYHSLEEEILIDELDALLTKAVERQMLSDVPVGFFLSGGLDSSLLVAIARKLYPNKLLPCFTIDAQGDSSYMDGFANDLFYAKKAAAYLNVELSIVKADIDIVEDFDKMIWHLDEPQADAAPLNVLKIASYAREKGIKVLIGGTGGDDLFSGYRRHKALEYEPIFEKVPSFLKSIIHCLASVLPLKPALFRRLKKLVKHIHLDQKRRLLGYFEWIDPSLAKSLLLKTHISNIQYYEPTTYLNNLLDETELEDNLLKKMLFVELKSFLVDHNLNYMDKMAMSKGIEARVPYLDTELVRFAQCIPPALNIKNGQTKYILKKVAERYLPKEIIYRPKTGFGAPVRKWIIEDLDEMIESKLSEKNLQQQGVFDYVKVRELIDLNKSGKVDASYTIWAILSVNSWLNQFSKKY